MEDKLTDDCINGLVYERLDGIKVGQIYKYLPHDRFSSYYGKYVVSHLYTSMGTKFATIIFNDGYAEPVTTEKIKKDLLVVDCKNWLDAFTQNLLCKELKITRTGNYLDGDCENEPCDRFPIGLDVKKYLESEAK